jgi:LPXTG-motif cell wall-anchored protein
MNRSRLTALLAALALAASPAAAFGQNAGDDQYEDPFGDDAPSSGASPTPTPAPIQETAPGVGSEPEEPSAPAPAAPEPDADAPAPAASAGELPRTGGDPAVIGLLGMSLMLGGAGLRLRLRPAGPSRGERFAS